MPSTYAHYRMGQQVRALLDGNERRVIEDYAQLYLIGLHGPDILFYYHPLKADPVNQIGYEFHKHSGREFFARALRILEQHPENPEPYLAYTYGVLNHFALDVACHGYIDEKIAASGISHTEIEVEFDRSLLLADGKDPLRQCLTRHIAPTMENARVICPFYPPAEARQVQQALRGMISYNRLLIAPSHAKRGMIYALLKASENYTEMHGLLVNYEENPACADSTEKLGELYRKARQNAVRYIRQFDGVWKGEQELEPIFSYSFGSVLVEKGETDEI